jgi:hypothetical protein
MSDVPYGVLLLRVRFFYYFGCSKKICSKNVLNQEIQLMLGIHNALPVGLEGSPDLASNCSRSYWNDSSRN